MPAKGPLPARGRSHRHSRHTDKGNAVIRGCSHASREQGKKGQMTMEEVTPPPTRQEWFRGPEGPRQQEQRS